MEANVSTQYVAICQKCLDRTLHFHAQDHSIVVSKHYGGYDKGTVVTTYGNVDDDMLVMPDVFDTVGAGEVITVREIKAESGRGKVALPRPDGRPGGWDYPRDLDPLTGRDIRK